MSFILLGVYLFIIIYFIHKAKFFNSTLFPKYIPIIIFITKFIGGIGVYLIYAKFYGARASSDIFKYFDDGNIIHSSLTQNPLDYFRMVTGIGADSPHLDKYYNTCCFWIKDFNYGLFNDNRIVIRFNAIVRLISLGNIHIHTLFMSFISFSGLWGIYKIFEQNILNTTNQTEETLIKKQTVDTSYKNYNLQKWLIIFMIFFFPSVYFWTSGVLKEGILMFAFGILLYNFSQLIKGNDKTKPIIWIIITSLILLFSKFYVLVAALPGILFIILIALYGKKYFAIKLLGSVLIFIILSLLTEPLIGVNFTKVLANKQHDFINYTNSLNSVGSLIEIPKLEPNLKSIIVNSPSAFFRTLFRPSVFEINNLMSLMAALENLLISLLILLSVIFFSKKNLSNPWLWFSILFTVILFTLSGLTTPVLGALVRYKAPALPFLGITLIYLFDFEKFNRLTSTIFKRK